MMKKTIGTALGLVLGTAMFTASAAEFDLTLATLAVPGTTFDSAIKGIPDRIEKATNGRVKITVNDSLVGGTQLASAVRDGRVDMVSAIHPYLSGQEPRMGLSNLPGLINTAADYKFLIDGFYGKDLAEVWKTKWNSTVLAEGLWSNQLVWSKKPLNKVEDFKGMKMRVHNRETAILMSAIGAKPTPMAAAEVMAGLQRGVIDGLTTSACYGFHQEFWRIAKHVYNWRIAPYTGWAVLVNNEVWAKIPADLQVQIRDAMAEMQADKFRTYYAQTRECVSGLQAKGVKFEVADDSEIARLFVPKNTDAVYKGWVARAKEVGFDGQAYIDQTRKALGNDLNYK
ncbi:MAG: TRAP-type C4-dicarboxylate transport system substrate-binding protein [Gammaproteobacteria bacterium]|jgi:TRAP-type C4-dicarboxylate transport system substrate-binding protein